MADSSEKVSFRVDVQCSSLRAEAFLVFDKDSQPTLGQQITDIRPTIGRLLAEDFRKRRSTTVGRLSANSWPTAVRLLADCRPTVFWGSCSSLFPKIVQILKDTNYYIILPNLYKGLFMTFLKTTNIVILDINITLIKHEDPCILFNIISKLMPK